MIDASTLALFTMNTLRHNYAMLKIVKERTYDDPKEMIDAISAEMLLFGEGSGYLIGGNFPGFAKWFLDNTDEDTVKKLGSIYQEMVSEAEANG